LGDSKDEILINKLGILNRDTIGLVGPSVDLSIAHSYCRMKGVPLHTLTKSDLDFFDLEMVNQGNVEGNVVRENSNQMLMELVNKGFGGEFKSRVEKEVFYKNMNSKLNQMLTGDLNKMLSKHAIDILNSEYGFNLPLTKGDFEDIYLKGRCEVVTPGKDFG
jgi:hypothetical protein